MLQNKQNDYNSNFKKYTIQIRITEYTDKSTN